MLLHILGELLHAVLAEAPARADGGDWQFGLVQLDAGRARVNHDFDDLLEVIPPDRVVAAGLVADLLVVFHLHPLGMHGRAVQAPGRAFLKQVGHDLAVGVDDAVWIIVLQAGGEGVGVLVLGELPQPVPVLLLLAFGQFVDGGDAAGFFVNDGGELPALHLKHDGEQLDAAAVALRDELAVVHVAKHLLAHIGLAKGLVV